VKFSLKCIFNIFIYFNRLANIKFEKTRVSNARKVSYIFFNALIFCFLGFHGSEGTMRFSLEHYPLENLRVAYNAVYYNFVTFTTLGYGDFSPSGIGKLFAFTESFIGAFLMAFFVITIYKQMMER